MPRKPRNSLNKPETKQMFKTVGELRKRLKDLGSPWEPLISLSDQDPLPQPARGGQPEAKKAKDAYPTGEKMKSVLSESPPANPFLQQEWLKAGWMTKKQTHGIAGSSQVDAPSEEHRGKANASAGTSSKRRKS